MPLGIGLRTLNPEPCPLLPPPPDEHVAGDHVGLFSHAQFNQVLPDHRGGRAMLLDQCGPQRPRLRASMPQCAGAGEKVEGVLAFERPGQ